MFKSAMKKSHYIMGTSSIDFGEKYELDTGSSLTKKNLALTDPPFKTGSTMGQSSSAQNMLSKSNKKDMVRLMRKLMPPEAYVPMFCRA